MLVTVAGLWDITPSRFLIPSYYDIPSSVITDGGGVLLFGRGAPASLLRDPPSLLILVIATDVIEMVDHY